MAFSVVIERLSGWVAGRRVELPLAATATVVIPDVEADEERHREDRGDNASASIALGLFIAYRDAKGQLSQRRISCKRYEPAGDNLFAFCFERRAYRRFKVARIVEVASVETGELFDRDELIAGLRLGGLPMRDERLTRVLTVLVFLMRCDREAHPTERAVLSEAVEIFALRFDGDGTVIAQGERLAALLAPDGDDFLAALAWIAARPERKQLVRLVEQFAERVVVADGQITSDESIFSRILSDSLVAMNG